MASITCLLYRLQCTLFLKVNNVNNYNVTNIMHGEVLVSILQTSQIVPSHSVKARYATAGYRTQENFGGEKVWQIRTTGRLVKNLGKLNTT